MQTLVLFRAAPGAGKSTFIDTHGLRPYALSADELRMLCRSPQMTPDGSYQIDTNSESVVWSTLFSLLEQRMKNGEFTVIDATNSKTSEMNAYKNLCDKYRYRMYCIDMTDLPIEECKRRNASRVPLKVVPDECIDKMYSRFKTQKIPSGITVLKPDEFDRVFFHKIDLSEYKKIVHIGDIHGAHTALMEYFKDGFRDDYFYIFLGDYTDRGIENAETLNFMMGAVQRKNVLALQGNHEKWIWEWANGENGSKSNEFEFVTKPQLEEANLDKKLVRKFCRRLGQCAWYTYEDKEIFVSHGGIPNLPENPSLIATYQYIHGVGKYGDADTVAKTWLETTADNMYQVHGHRNITSAPVAVNDRVFNLEGKVEFGGYLRIVELDADGFHPVEIKNTVFRDPVEFARTKEINNSDIAEIVSTMRRNKYIVEKQFGNISSFNFTRDAFEGKVWNQQTVLARGLYIDTKRMKVACRGFSKFFNINEREETKIENLERTLQFPITCYVKENGFLGLVSYDADNDDLFVTTKSHPNGLAANLLRDMLTRKVSPENLNKIKEYCKENDVTFVFECVDMENDPHIIDYPESRLFLLAVVNNTIAYSQMEYTALQNVGAEFGLEVKEKAYEIANWQEFIKWYDEVRLPDWEYNGRVIEGFVIEDANGFMTKLKLNYYCVWKHLRTISGVVLRQGYILKTSQLVTPTENMFYGWLKNLWENTDKEARSNIPKNIVHLRRMFYESGYTGTYGS